ncbi:hypothetical protein RGQ29_029981 [Quercus rubra]|uniref:Kiwellin n=1 Tax=Quercus rubra TaxID=3512 RepID=A0AAN7EGN6_QUERU|nr:hypothetical protein RGQ29_029981 [Quercus rubra]
MANIVLLLVPLFLIFNIISLPLPARAISSCNGPCKTLNDCNGQLICINGKCNDDPDIGTHICSGGGGGGGGGSSPSPSQNCKSSDAHPQLTSSTQARLTHNDFSEGGDGGGPSECDEKYHNNSERVVALSTGWYNHGSRCGKMIRITASNGRSVTAKHAGQPPCKNNAVDGSSAVWNALGLNQDLGNVGITWSMA